MIAKTEPQAAYRYFITAFKHKPSYIMRTIPDIYQLNQLNEVITSEFMPAITGGIHCSTIEWKLLALPSKFPIFAEISNQEHEYFLSLSKGLSTRITNQEIEHPSETDAQKKLKGLRIAKTSSTFKEHSILSYNLNQEQRTMIFQLQRKDAISKNNSPGILFEFAMVGHSQDFQLIENVVKKLNYSMLFLQKRWFRIIKTQPSEK